MSSARQGQGKLRLPSRKLASRKLASRKLQRGVALITVMMVFAIAALVASKIMLTQAMDVQRVTGLVNRTQAHYYAVAAEQLAMRLLQEDAQEDFDRGVPWGVDHLGENWAQGPVTLDIDAIGSVVVAVVDLNRYYNLNNIVNDDGSVDSYEVGRLQSMFDALSLPRELVANLQDYVDDDDQEEGFGTEGRYYAEQSPPYAPANQMLSDVSELRLVKGFTPEVVNILAPHVTAVRLGKMSLNVNTASAVALTTLQLQKTTDYTGPRGIGLSRAQDIADLHEYEYFDSIDTREGFEGRIFTLHPVAQAIDTNTRTQKIHTEGHLQGWIEQSGGTGTLSDLHTRGGLFEINVRANYAGSIVYLTSIVVESVDKATGIASYEILERRETDNFRRFAENIGSNSET